MCRGLSKTQVAIAWALYNRGPQTLRELARAVGGAEPTRTRLTALARSVRSLRRRNWVAATGRWRYHIALTPSARVALTWLHTDTG